MKHIDLTPFEGRALDESDWQHLMMRILFTNRSLINSYAVSLLKKAIKQGPLNPEFSDPILTLLGFRRDNLPVMTTTFNSEMGHLFETIVRVIFKLSDPKKYEDNFSKAKAKLTDAEKSKYKKFKPDYLWGNIGIEVKYRYGSHEGKTSQTDTIKSLNIMGYTGLMLCLRPSPNAADLRRNGWIVLEGQDTINYIREQTGVDLTWLCQIALRNPLTRKRMDELQSFYDERTMARLECDFYHALENHREPVHRIILDDDCARSKFLEDAGFIDNQLGPLLDHILKSGPAVLNDPAIQNFVSEANKNINNASEIRKAG